MNRRWGFGIGALAAVFWLMASLFPGLAEDAGNDTLVREFFGQHPYPGDGDLENFARRGENALGRKPFASQLVSYAGHQQMNLGVLYYVRLLGAKLAPDFYEEARKQLPQTVDPYGKRQVIIIFRDAPLNLTLAAVTPELKDRREAEKLEGEARGDGKVPDRVCDTTYDVLCEALAADRNNAPSTEQYDSWKKRDQKVDALFRKLSQPPSKE